jgi:hypothetical protein
MARSADADHAPVNERRKGSVFVGLKEGEFWQFKCSYKYLNGEIDRYR